MAAPELRFRRLRPHSLDQGMTYVVHFNAVAGVKRRLEGEDADHSPHIATNCLYPSARPGPGLRPYKINHRNAAPSPRSRQPQIKTREIHRNQARGPPLFERPPQPPIKAIDARQVGSNLEKSDHC